MPQFKIKNRFSFEIQVSGTAKTFKEFIIKNRADLWGADLRRADLRRADLRGVDLDFSCLPLWCGSFGIKVDTRFIWQLIAHLARFNNSRVSKNAKEAITLLEPYRNEFCKYRNDVEKIG
jgi:uncharacterized protein YjbI with pentapeptide repeats